MLVSNRRQPLVAVSIFFFPARFCKKRRQECILGRFCILAILCRLLRFFKQLEETRELKLLLLIMLKMESTIGPWNPTLSHCILGHWINIPTKLIIVIALSYQPTTNEVWQWLEYALPWRRLSCHSMETFIPWDGDKWVLWWGGVKIRQGALCLVHTAWVADFFFVNKKWLLIELSYFIRRIHAISHGMDSDRTLEADA